MSLSANLSVQSVASASLTAGTLWTPSLLKEKVTHWYDAKDASTFTLTGATVNEWRDKSGNGRHLNSNIFPPDSPAYGATAFNGQPGVDYTGYKWQDTFPSSTGQSGEYVLTFFMAHEWGNDGQTNGRMFAHGAENNSDAFHYKRGSSPTNGYLALEGAEESFYEGWTTSPKISSGGKFGNTPSDYKLWHDGNLLTKSSQGPDGTQNTTSSSLKINAGGNYQVRNDQRIGEMVFCFGYALSDAERQTVEGYLAHRWALAGALPSGHPYKLVAPTFVGLQGSAQIVATATAAFPGGAVTLDGSGSVIASASVAASVGKPLSGSALSDVQSIIIPLSVSKPLAASGAVLASATSSLTTGKPIAGSGGVLASTTGALAIVKPLSGSAANLATLAGALAEPALGGAGVVLTTATASLSKAVGLAGSALSDVQSIVAPLSVVKPLGGSGQSLATISGSLSLSVPLAASGAALASTSADLSKTVPLAGSGLTVVTSTAALAKAVGLAGDGQAVSTASGNLARTATLLGSAAGVVSAQASFAGDAALAASVQVQAQATAAVSKVAVLAGSAATQANASAALSVSSVVALFGDAAAILSAAANASVAKPVGGPALSIVSASGGLSVVTIPATGRIIMTINPVILSFEATAETTTESAIKFVA